MLTLAQVQVTQAKAALKQQTLEETFKRREIPLRQRGQKDYREGLLFYNMFSCKK